MQASVLTDTWPCDCEATCMHKANAEAVSAEAGAAGVPGAGHPAVCGGQPGPSLR